MKFSVKFKAFSACSCQLKDLDYLNKNSKGNLFILKHYLYSVFNFQSLGLCQETNNWVYVASYISIV